jgi:phospholipid/cholesterol/gamma-HCH transport system ATP-binding protein
MDGFDPMPVIHRDDDRKAGRADSSARAAADGGAGNGASPDGAESPSRRTHSVIATSRTPIVQLKDVHKSFGRQKVLRGITLEFPTGQTTVVLGPSGCGKSVMLKHLVALLRPDRGEVLFEGQRIDDLRESRLGPIRRQFGFLFQMGALFDSMSVRENIAFPLREHTRSTDKEIERRVRQVLQLVGLEDTMSKMPADLSGGQRKRIALARAIVLEPKVILYDEPTTGLDPIRSDVINELILRLQRELRVTSIVVTHDLGSAFKVADFTVMMHEGKILFRGTPDELRASSDPVVQRFLRGEASEEELEGIRVATASSIGGVATAGRPASEEPAQ